MEEGRVDSSVQATVFTGVHIAGHGVFFNMIWYCWRGRQNTWLGLFIL